MNEMVEQVARAFWEDREDLPWEGVPAFEWTAYDEEIRNDSKDRYRRRARIAIIAMREPTEAMINAAHNEEALASRLRGNVVIPTAAITMWRAMIDAASRE